MFHSEQLKLGFEGWAGVLETGARTSRGGWGRQSPGEGWLVTEPRKPRWGQQEESAIGGKTGGCGPLPAPQPQDTAWV